MRIFTAIQLSDDQKQEGSPLALLTIFVNVYKSTFDVISKKYVCKLTIFNDSFIG